MFKLLIVVLLIVNVRCCYWNKQCPYQLYSSKTPYDSVRGDIRDFETPTNCEVVSIWSLHRHGNRNPGTGTTIEMKEASLLKEEIIASFEAGNSQLCAQDIENLRKWTWNDTLDTSHSSLTGTGYKELYDIAKRVREKYPHLLQGTADDFYFRPTSEQRTITSCAAYVHGLTDGTNLTVTVVDAQPRDDVIRPYENCIRYQEDVKNGPTIAAQLDSYFSSPRFVAIQIAVQQRLGIPTQLTATQVYSMYELCRFYRSWTPNLQCPWCAVFTNDDLNVLEYYDDIRHYYRNGHGSWVNQRLGQLPLKDLYENFEARVMGQGRKVVSYFTHDTMLEMVFSALGLYQDDLPIQSLIMDPDRLWRTSYIGAFSVNFMAVLNSCNELGNQTFRVQLFINEQETAICPVDGCTWEEFVYRFQKFSNATLDFCSRDYVPEIGNDIQTNSASPNRAFWGW